MLALTCALSALVAFSATALAAKPKENGCWTIGRCDATHAQFFLVEDHIRQFTVPSSCLGTSVSGSATMENRVSIPRLGLSPHNTFSYGGPGTALVDPNASGEAKEISVPIKISGDFPTSTTTDITLTVKYKTCGTEQLKLKFIMPPGGDM